MLEKHPIRIKLKAPCGLLATTLLVVWVTACGGGAKDTRFSPARSNSTKLSFNSGLSPSHAVSDYDTDDYTASDDADDDDSTGHLDSDGDSDNPSGGIYDSDDTNLANYSHSASVTETRVVALLVRRYLVDAAAADGTKACSMLLASVAGTVPAVLGGVGEPPYSRGKTCAEVLSKIFRFYHGQLTVEAQVLRVLRVGVKGDKGLALLTAKTRSRFPERVIALQREHGTWKIDGVLDQEEP